MNELKLVSIVPTKELGSEGYYTAKAQEHVWDSDSESYKPIGNSWTLDSITINGDTTIDFTKEGGINIFHSPMVVIKGLSTIIISGNEAEKYLKM